MAKKETQNGMEIIDSHIKNQSFAKVYLLGGEQDYLRNQFRDKLVAALVAPGDTMNYIVYKSEQAKPENILEFANTLPFFAERRVVVVEDSGFFHKGNERMEEGLQNIPDTTVIIFVEKQIDGRLKLTNIVKKIGCLASFDAPGDAMLRTWLAGRFSSAGLMADKETLQYLIDHIGTNMYNLANECEKLISYCVDAGVVRIRDIDRLCVNQVEDKVFEMMDAIVEKDKQKTMQIYDDLLTLQEAPMKILALVQRHYMILVKLRFAKDTGTPWEQLAQVAGIRPFFLKKYMNQCERYTTRMLLDAVKRCQKADADIKSGAMRDRLAVEMLILECVI